MQEGRSSRVHAVHAIDNASGFMSQPKRDSEINDIDPQPPAKLYRPTPGYCVSFGAGAGPATGSESFELASLAGSTSTLGGYLGMTLHLSSEHFCTFFASQYVSWSYFSLQRSWSRVSQILPTHWNEPRYVLCAVKKSVACQPRPAFLGNFWSDVENGV